MRVSSSAEWHWNSLSFSPLFVARAILPPLLASLKFRSRLQLSFAFLIYTPRERALTRRSSISTAALNTNFRPSPPPHLRPRLFDEKWSWVLLRDWFLSLGAPTLSEHDCISPPGKNFIKKPWELQLLKKAADSIMWQGNERKEKCIVKYSMRGGALLCLRISGPTFAPAAHARWLFLWSCTQN